MPADAADVETLLAEIRGSRVSVRVPQRGDKRALLETVARNAGQALTLHGWVYGISDGLVKDLRVEADSVAKLEADYQAALAAVARSGR